MKTKKLLSIAIIAALPFAANATDPVGPAAVPANGTPVVATASGPYQTAEIGNNDGEHIASTAYVKGAYNDTIAAVNKVNSTVKDLGDLVDEIDRIKQHRLHITEDTDIDNWVLGGSELSNVAGAAGHGDDDGIGSAMETLLENKRGGTSLVTAEAIAVAFIDMGIAINNKGVSARDTWGSNHTTNVALINQ